MIRPLLLKPLFCLAVFTGVSACDPTVKDPGAVVFETAAPDSRAYRQELATRIRSNPEEMRYYLKGYRAQAGREYLELNFAGEGFAATGLVQVSNWQKLPGIHRTKGLGYSGAELRGLKLQVREDPAGARLVFQDVAAIID